MSRSVEHCHWVALVRVLDECGLCIRRSACRLDRYLACARSSAFSESSFFTISRVLCASDRLLSSGKEWAAFQESSTFLLPLPPPQHTF